MFARIRSLLAVATSRRARRAREVLAFSLVLGVAGSAVAGRGDPSPTAPVARIGASETIDAAALDARVRDPLARLERRRDAELRRVDLEYARSRDDLLHDELEKLVDERVLELESKARGVSTLALIGTIPDPVITDADVRAFYDEHRQRMDQPLEALAPRIRQYLVEQAVDRNLKRFMGELRVKYDAQVLREPLRADVGETRAGHARGTDGAPVTIVEFADFECPYCAQMSPTLKSVLEKYPGKVRIDYRHLPLTQIHPNARRAAEASECAREQGRFWEFYDAMYEPAADHSAAGIATAAQRLGLDRRKFDECVAAARHAARVDADIAIADRLGLQGTPVFFVNGRMLNGTVPVDAITALVDDELRRSASRPAPETGATQTAGAAAPSSAVR